MFTVFHHRLQHLLCQMQDLNHVCSYDYFGIYEPRSDAHWTWKTKQLSPSLRTATSSLLGALQRSAHYGTDRKLGPLLILNSLLLVLVVNQYLICNYYYCGYTHCIICVIIFIIMAIVFVLVCIRIVIY